MDPGSLEELINLESKMATLAVGDTCTGSNSCPIDPETMAKLLKVTYCGIKVDF